MTFSRQFIIMDQPFNEDGFAHITLSCGKILSCQKDLHLQIIKEKDGKVSCCILGWTFQADPGRKDPGQEVLQAADRQSLEKVLYTWSGRWLLIYDQYIYMDACGLMGCFYTDTGMVSSSMSCLNEALHRENKNLRLKHGFGLDYYPGTGTGYKDTMRLMPSQTYDLLQRKWEVRQLVLGTEQQPDDEHRIEKVIVYFRTILQNLERTYDGRIMLPLTGGYDSRTMMALLEYSGVDYTAFTMEHENISELDVEAPAHLAALVGREYHFIKREGTKDKERLRVYDRHCAGMAVDEDRNFYAYGQYPEGEKRTAVLRAGVWECARYSIYNWVENSGFQVEKYKKKYVNIRWRKDMQDSLNAYFEYVKENPQHIKWPVRFYREQRVGCWLSGVEQALTVIPNMDSLQLCNCGCILELLGQLDFDLLDGKKHEVKIIEKTCPQLLQVTLQNRENKFRKNKKTELREKDWQYLKNCWFCLDGAGKLKESVRFIKKKLRRK